MSKAQKRLEREREEYRRRVARANPTSMTPSERNKLLGLKGDKGKKKK